MRASDVLSRHLLLSLRRKKPFSVVNSLQTGEKREHLSLKRPSLLKWYACGPTVYDDAHLGHARAYVSFDIIRRVISLLGGARVEYALGVTDVDDKILLRASERNISPLELARTYESRFFQDMNSMNVLRPTKILRVTEHISELQTLISDLIKLKSAYVTETGNVYFSVSSAGERYWQLDPSRRAEKSTNDVDAENEVSPNETLSEKKDPRDFVLWKRSPTGQYELEWDSPWGFGRPGWHVECSAMAMSAMGPDLDLHTGGIDLRFPHHTNELAMSESKLCFHGPLHADIGTEERWSQAWLHAGHLHVSGRKMSKSLKNFTTVQEFLKEGTADAFRMFCLMHKYSAPVEYSPDKLVAPNKFLTRIRTFLSRDALSESLNYRKTDISRPSMHPQCRTATDLEAMVRNTEDEIEDALTDDFDTPRAVASLANLVTAGNSIFTRNANITGAAALAHEDAKLVISQTLGMFGISSAYLHASSGKIDSDDPMTNLDLLTDTLVEFRSAVRNAARKKDTGAIFQACDVVRQDVRSQTGITIEDQKDGSSKWRREQ